jgi:hypothetical protein
MGKSQGLAGKNVRHANAPKREPVSNRAAIKGVSQIGQAMGNHITESRHILKNVPKAVFDGSRGYEPPGMISDPVKAVGVGGGRNIYKTGSQQGLVTRANNPRGRDFDV